MSMSNTVLDLQQRFNKMTPLQRKIVYRLWTKINDCEGKSMPEKYWCDSCTRTHKRLIELFTRFERMNIDHQSNQYKYNASAHFGFSDPGESFGPTNFST